LKPENACQSFGELTQLGGRRLDWVCGSGLHQTTFQTNAPIPVIALPTMSVFISRVPSYE
jgi:6-phosphogluconate dehydrogenase (decarboxylating)